MSAPVICARRARTHLFARLSLDAEPGRHCPAGVYEISGLTLSMVKFCEGMMVVAAPPARCGQGEGGVVEVESSRRVVH